jgi:hypothetical protein
MAMRNDSSKTARSMEFEIQNFSFCQQGLDAMQDLISTDRYDVECVSNRHTHDCIILSHIIKMSSRKLSPKTDERFDTVCTTRRQKEQMTRRKNRTF